MGLIWCTSAEATSIWFQVHPAQMYILHLLKFGKSVQNFLKDIGVLFIIVDVVLPV